MLKLADGGSHPTVPTKTMVSRKYYGRRELSSGAGVNTGVTICWVGAHALPSTATCRFSVV